MRVFTIKYYLKAIYVYIIYKKRKEKTTKDKSSSAALDVPSPGFHDRVACKPSLEKKSPKVVNTH